MKHIPAAVLFCLLALIKTEAVAAVTFGGQDCGQWIANPNKVWLAGYLSGVNAAVANESHDPLDQMNSIDQAVLWVTNYCRANPLRRVTTAALALYRELDTQAMKGK